MKNRLGKIEERPYGVASTTPPPPAPLYARTTQSTIQ